MLLANVIEMYRDHMQGIDRSPETIDIYTKDLRAFQRHLEESQNGPAYLEDVTTADIEGFLRMLKDVKNYAPNSRSRNHYTIQAFYKFAYKKELVPRNVALSVEPVRLPKKERQHLTEREVAQLAAEIEHDLVRLVVMFLYHTGLRISECLKLTLADVDLDAGVIRVLAGKGNKDRTVPISDKLRPQLADYRDNWRDAYGSDRFFATKKTGRLSAVYVNHTIGEAVQRLGWDKKVSCHIMRHSFASNIVRKNVGLVQIQKLLGHSSLAVTSVYTHTNLDQLTDAVNAL